jgi:CheY-like chemotaxis protein
VTSVTAHANSHTGTNHRAVPDLTPQLGPPVSNPEGSAIILVVERDPHIRELESYFLNEAGYTVDFAADGIDALHRARALRPDIIITEVLVPKLDGLALCRTVKSDPDLRHIVMLIFSILAVQSRAQEAGADAFLMKPLAEKRLVETVRQLLVMRRAMGFSGEDA